MFKLILAIVVRMCRRIDWFWIDWLQSSHSILTTFKSLHYVEKITPSLEFEPGIKSSVLTTEPKRRPPPSKQLSEIEFIPTSYAKSAKADYRR